MTEAVFTTLREAILDGSLPPATWLREEELATELKVSRTPIREALRRLTDEALTVYASNNGTMVAPMTMEDILAVYVVRESLDALAARLAAERRPAGLINQLIIQLQEMRDVADTDTDDRAQTLARLNIEFHASIRQASNNAYVERFLTQVEHAVRRFSSTTFEQPGRAHEIVAEHELIVNAITAGDGQAAAQHASAHMQRSREVRLAIFLHSSH